MLVDEEATIESGGCQPQKIQSQESPKVDQTQESVEAVRLF